MQGSEPKAALILTEEKKETPPQPSRGRGMKKGMKDYWGRSPVGLERCSHIAEVNSSSLFVPTQRSFANCEAFFMLLIQVSDVGS